MGPALGGHGLLRLLLTFHESVNSLGDRPERSPSTSGNQGNDSGARPRGLPSGGIQASARLGFEETRAASAASAPQV